MTYRYNGPTRLADDPDILGFGLQPCGTSAAAQRHYLRGEKPCEECAEAERVRWSKQNKERRANPSRGKGFKPDACGTYRGYRRHVYHGLEPCDPCRAAHAADCKERRERRKSAADKSLGAKQ
jgi:hypothetical protein